jgi:DNA mismatch repair protein MutL
MPAKIQILPDDIAQTIAAGEVVERPASVVKELVENAIDAGASEIVVDLRAGGFELIRVQDNGEGMEREDVSLALERHATSKIRRIEDLYAIHTLGFRGEALPSIASVSEIRIKTRVPHSIHGTCVVSKGGAIKHLSDIGCPVGTEVEVKNLFFNLPVKRKFLKSIPLELRHALSQFLRLSLCYPSISFKLVHDGRTLQEHPKSTSLFVRVEAILGKEMVGQLRAFEHEDGGMAVSGYASLPTLSRGTSDGIYSYVNGRFVKDRILYRAILEAYRHHLASKKFPAVILFLVLPASSVDVNVHPTKAEVKFKDPERVFHTVFSALRAPLTASSGLDAPFSGDEIKVDEKTMVAAGTSEVSPASRVPYPLYSSAASWDRGNLFRMVKEERGKGAAPLHIVGQAQGTYILCESEKGLIVIDQHAAHERVLFEKLKRQYESESVPLTQFLLPVLIELSAEESFLLTSHLKEFQSLGLEIDPVGEKAYAIRSIPSFLRNEDPKGVVQKALEELAFVKRGGGHAQAADPILISLACHTAVKGSSILKREEMEELVENLISFPLSVTCPHGRPIVFFLGWEELAKEFKRSYKRP